MTAERGELNLKKGRRIRERRGERLRNRKVNLRSSERRRRKTLVRMSINHLVTVTQCNVYAGTVMRTRSHGRLVAARDSSESVTLDIDTVEQSITTLNSRVNTRHILDSTGY